MIAHLKGRLAATGADHAVIDVGGVGYLVGTSARTLAALEAAGDAVTVYTEMLVAEDSIRLMGFASAAERDWFRLLTGVQGRGGEGRAGDPLDPLARRSPDRGRPRRLRGDHPGERRGAQARPAHRQRAQGQGRRHGVRRRRGGPPGRRDGGGCSVGADEPGLPARRSEQRGGAPPTTSWGAGATLDALVRLALRKAAK